MRSTRSSTAGRTGRTGARGSAMWEFLLGLDLVRAVEWPIAPPDAPFGELVQPCGRGASRAGDVERRRGMARRAPVAEAPVDGRLRGPQRRHGLAGGAHVVELAAHELGEQPAAAV